MMVERRYGVKWFRAVGGEGGSNDGGTAIWCKMVQGRE